MKPKAAGTAPIAFLAAALACALAHPAAGEAADSGTRGPPEDMRFGLDAHAYVHAGSEGFLGQSDPDEGAPPIWLFAALGSTEARAYRLVARLGLALSAQGQPPRAGHAAANGPIRYYRFGLAECTLRLRFGGAEAEDGFLAGLAGLQGNPDAILFGDYLARFSAYPAVEIRRAPEWDSLGTPAPRENAQLSVRSACLRTRSFPSGRTTEPRFAAGRGLRTRIRFDGQGRAMYPCLLDPENPS